jgi:hypothetical protein
MLPEQGRRCYISRPCAMTAFASPRCDLGVPNIENACREPGRGRNAFFVHQVAAVEPGPQYRGVFSPTRVKLRDPADRHVLPRWWRGPNLVDELAVGAFRQVGISPVEDDANYPRRARAQEDVRIFIAASKAVMCQEAFVASPQRRFSDRVERWSFIRGPVRR